MIRLNHTDLGVGDIADPEVSALPGNCSTYAIYVTVGKCPFTTLSLALDKNNET